jgi:DNA repair exonuclease SbcCD ATPase subunit
MSSEDYNETIFPTPISAWLGTQKVHIIPVFGNAADGEYYAWCDICGAQPYGIEKCNDKLHKLKTIHDAIWKLRQQVENIQTPEAERKIMEHKISQLQLNTKAL